MLERTAGFAWKLAILEPLKIKTFLILFIMNILITIMLALIRYLIYRVFIHQVEFNEIQGGSIRLLAQKAKESGQSQQVLDIVEAEKQKSTFKLETLLHWQSEGRKMSVLGK